MDEPRWLNEAEMRAWRGYRRMRQLLDLEINRDLARESGLSEPDYDVLSNLSEADGHRGRLVELADRMLWSKSRLSHHITRMEQRGLVTREECPSDGRGAVIVLTDGGLRAIQAAAPGHVESVRQHLIDLLTEEQIDTLATITQTVLGHLTSPSEPGIERELEPAASRPGDEREPEPAASRPGDEREPEPAASRPGDERAASAGRGSPG